MWRGLPTTWCTALSVSSAQTEHTAHAFAGMGHGKQVLHLCKRAGLTTGGGPLCCELWGLYKADFKSSVERSNYKWRQWSLFHKNIFFFQFSSVTQSWSMLSDPMVYSTPGLSIYHQLPEFTQTHDHVGDAIQPSHPLLSFSPILFSFCLFSLLMPSASESFPMSQFFASGG